MLADRGLAADQAGLVGLAGCDNGFPDGIRVVAVDGDRVPARRLETLLLVCGVGDADRTVDGDVVVVPEHDQLAQGEVPGKREGFLADAFHEAAVTRDDVGVVVDEVVAKLRVQVRFGDGHADGIGEALAQRTCRRLHAGRVPVFGVARRDGAELTKVADLVHVHLREASEMEERVDQHRAVARTEDEAVAVVPVGVGRVEVHELAPEHGGRVGHSHRHSRMARIGLLHGVHG